MADFADHAADRQQRINDAALLHRRPERKLLPNGTCWNPLCGLDLENPKALYCGAFCAEEHDRHGHG